MKKLLILLLSALMLASCASTSVPLQEAPAAEVQASVSGSIVEVSKYGNVYLDVTVPEFLSVFSEGDLVTIKAGGQEVLAPVVTAYSDVDTAQPLVKVDGTNVEVALSYADFAGTYGTALGSVIDITMAEKGGYLTEYEIRHLVKSEDRADYSSDVQFANIWYTALQVRASVMREALMQTGLPMRQVSGLLSILQTARNPFLKVLILTATMLR